MQQLIKEIKLPDDNYSFLNDASSPDNRLQFLSKINIFVGENNSGKSRLLRSLLSNELDYTLNAFSIEDYNEVVEGLKNDFRSYFQDMNIHIESFSRIYKNLNEINNIKYLNHLSNFENFQNLHGAIRGLELDKNASIKNIPFPKIAQNLLKIYQERTSVFREYLDQSLKLPEFSKIYIPILRGTKPVYYTDKNRFEYEDCYQKRIRTDYFNDSEAANSIEIFTGISFYDKIKSCLLGTHEERKLIAEYEIYLSHNFFDNKPIVLIPSLSSNVITVKIGDETERPIYKLGDGIESIIILTMPLFLKKRKNLLVFIEEPEKLLHPGLQRKLIETLLKQDGFENYQYFITTHSNHLLDIILDSPGISIYSLRKELDGRNHDGKDPKFLIENLSQGDISALELLGVRNSSVFLSNCTIWVEGITDRLYFRKYLKLYIEHMKSKNKEFIEFKEDFHYSFVEYGGGNITHWSFLDKEKDPINVDKLCGKLFLITDKDQNKEKRHSELKENLGDRFYCLRCKEVENLISKKVLTEVIKEYERGKPVETEFKESDYRNKSLGKFIDDILGTNRIRQVSYSKGNTIRDKVGFCNKVIRYTTEWDDLSKEAKKISEKIYQFIEKNNH